MAGETVAVGGEQAQALPSGGDDTKAEATPGTGEAASPAEATAETETFEDADDLLSSEEYEQVKDDPKKLRKALLKSYTQKTQAIARERDFVKALQDPERGKGIAKALAERLGFNVSEAPPAQNKVLTRLAEVFGTDTANQVAPAIADAVAEAVGPIKREHEQLVGETLARQSLIMLEAFEKKHPDWKQYEKQMIATGNKLMPHGMDEGEYMELLYSHATRHVQEARAAANAVNRINNSAAASDAGRAASGSKVSQRPPKNPTFREAAAAALAGQRFEE